MIFSLLKFPHILSNKNIQTLTWLHRIKSITTRVFMFTITRCDLVIFVTEMVYENVLLAYGKTIDLWEERSKAPDNAAMVYEKVSVEKGGKTNYTELYQDLKI